MSYLIKAVESALRAHTDRVTRDSPVTTMQFVALSVLEQRTGLTTAELARRSFVTPQSMHQMVMTLEELGYVTRGGAATRGRKRVLSITTSGRAVLAGLQERMTAVDGVIDDAMTAAESAMFRVLLSRVRDALVDDLRSHSASGGSDGDS